MSFFSLKSLTFVSVFALNIIDNGLKISPLINQNFIKMNTAKKATTPENSQQKEGKEDKKTEMKVSKSEEMTAAAVPAISVNDRRKNHEKMAQLLEREDMLEGYKDQVDKFILADTGFGSVISLENEKGVKMPIKNPEVLKQIYPILQDRCTSALERVRAEILEFTV